MHPARTPVSGARRERRTTQGQATPLVAVLLVVAALLALPLARLGREAADRARARTAADAAALAGVVDGEDAAAELAVANGGVLTAFAVHGNEVTVTVRVGDRQAVARAERTGGQPTGTGGAAGLAPAMLAALERAEAMLGRPIPIASGFRTREEQQALWDRRDQLSFPVAPPGTSRHEAGLAVDVPSGFVATLLTVVPASGLCQPMPDSDPIHFELCRWHPSG